MAAGNSNESTHLTASSGSVDLCRSVGADLDEREVDGPCAAPTALAVEVAAIAAEEDGWRGPTTQEDQAYRRAAAVAA
jgi:hypothetical protein